MPATGAKLRGEILAPVLKIGTSNTILAPLPLTWHRATKAIILLPVPLFLYRCCPLSIICLNSNKFAKNQPVTGAILGHNFVSGAAQIFYNISLSTISTWFSILYFYNLQKIYPSPINQIKNIAQC